MITFNARDTLQFTVDDIMGLEDDVTIIYEDGKEVVSTNRMLLMNSFFWEFHRRYPLTPILSTHCIEHIMKTGMYKSGTHMELLSILFRDTAEYNQLLTPKDTEVLRVLTYEVVNRIYNEMTQVSEEYISSIDILDFLEVVRHPVIKEIVSNTNPTSGSIYSAYDKLVKVLMTDEGLSKNRLVRAARKGIVNTNQLLQCIGIRGFVSEVDDSILTHPVMSNYAEGIKTCYEYLADSRSAAKALYFAGSNLEDAEYFARRLSLLCVTVERINYSDCGSTRYLEWRVQPPRYDDNGLLAYVGDLTTIVGKYYLDETTNTLKEIKTSDVHLNGQLLKLRSPLFCKTKDHHEVCEVCFGVLAKNISPYANLGHLCAASVTKKSSQSVLSTKHLLISAVSILQTLSEVAADFMTINCVDSTYSIKEKMKGKVASIWVDAEKAKGLIDVYNTESLDDLLPSRIFNINSIALEVLEGDLMVKIPITLTNSKKGAVFTIEFLHYLKEHGWDTANNAFRLPLDKWDFKHPIFKLPETEYSYSDHSKSIAKVIESKMAEISDRTKAGTPVSTLQELFALVNSKLQVNLAPLETIIYAGMVPNKSNFGLSRGAEEPVMAVSSLLIYSRSLSPALAYQRQHETLLNSNSYIKGNRPDSIMDVFICPAEVAKEYKGRGR